MTQIDRHAPGAFCWAELATTDQNSAKSFYGALFGWQANDVAMGADDFYSMFDLGGRSTAGAYTLRPDQRAQGVMPHWGLHVAVDSADRTAERAAALGGKVLMAPFDVFEAGRMAGLQDPTGAVIAVWQPKGHAGIGVGGVDGTLCWGELSTPEPQLASAFYTGLFGWRIAAEAHDPSGYLHIVNGADPIGGIPPAAQRDLRRPASWLAYFMVSDIDATAQKATERGAALHLAPMTIDGVGRLAVIGDPQGAVFAIFRSLRRPA